MLVNVSIWETLGSSAASEGIHVEISGSDSQFAWATGNDSLVASYEIVWRPNGALQWMYSVNVGDVGHVTLSLNKDNVQIGVRAAGADGKKSPTVLPLPVTWWANERRWLRRDVTWEARPEQYSRRVMYIAVGYLSNEEKVGSTGFHSPPLKQQSPASPNRRYH